MPTLEEISRQKLLAAAASYNPVNNPQAASTVARDKRGAALAAAQPAFQGPGVQGRELAVRTSPPLAFAQQKPQPPVQPASRMVNVGYSQGPGPTTTVQSNLTRGPSRPVVGLSAQSPAAVTGTGGGGIIPAAEARPVRTSAAVTTPPVAPVVQPSPLSQPHRAPAFDVQQNYRGIQGVNRVMNHDMPGEAPLFTNNPSAAAAYNEMGGPGLTPPNGDPSVRARSGSPVGYGGPAEGPVRYLNSKGQYVGPSKDPGTLPPRTDGGPETLSRENQPYRRGESLASAARTTAEWNAWDKQGESIPGKTGGFSVVPGLFSGVSTATDQALSDARHAAADRGDFAAVDNSYRTPEQKADFSVQQAQNTILKNIGNAPASQFSQALSAVGGLKGQSQTAAKGEQELAKGDIELQQQQQQQQQISSHINPVLEKLSSLDETTDPGGKQRAALIKQVSQVIPLILAGTGKTTTTQANRYSYAKPSVDPITSQRLPDTGGVLDTQTGTLIPLSQPSAAQPGGAPPAEGSQLQGPDGVIYTVKGGVPVGPDGKPYAGG